MINDINLLPDKILYRNQRILLNGAKAVLIIMIAAIIAYGVLYIRLERKDLEKQVAEVTARIDNSAVKALNESQNELSKKQGEKKELDEILKEVPVDRLKMTKLLERITGLMPSTIKAESINYTAEQGQLKLSLIGKNRADISLFLKLLHDDDEFYNVNLDAITGKVSPYQFSVVLGITQQGKTKK